MKFSIRLTKDDFKDDGMGPPTKLVIVPMIFLAAIAIVGALLTLLLT